MACFVHDPNIVHLMVIFLFIDVNVLICTWYIMYLVSYMYMVESGGRFPKHLPIHLLRPHRLHMEVGTKIVPYGYFSYLFLCMQVLRRFFCVPEGSDSTGGGGGLEGVVCH